MTVRRRVWDRLGWFLAGSPLIALGIAAALLAAGVLAALHGENQARSSHIHAQTVQARILAGSVAGALAFDDAEAMRDYLEALRANPEIDAAGVYALDGHRIASFGRNGAAAPDRAVPAAPHFVGGDLIVNEPVVQNGVALGAVYLRASVEPWTRRMMRYSGVAAIIVMACLLLAVLGASYAQLSEANQRLQEEAESRRQAEEALRQSQKMEAMGQLTGGVAHDFNNLLMVASSGLELMDRTDDPTRRERLRQGIRQAIDRGTKLTQQLLTFARRSPLKPEVIDLRERIESLHDLIARSLREDIAVEYSMPAGLWPIEVDGSQLDVAILNIAVNARDAMPDGGMLIVSARNVPATNAGEVDRVRLSLRDSGSGMPPELIEKVFEPFFTTKPAGHGTGLGLSQVYGFVHGSGGSIAIESKLGEGTTVNLLLPRCARAPVEPRADAAAMPEIGQARVLIAEDDDALADLVTGLVRELNCEPHRVGTAMAALALLEEGEHFDIVLSDMVMPGFMGGLDLARRIAEHWPDLPVVLMTGYSAAAAAAGEEGFQLLLKPYTIEQLGRALAAARGRRAT
ncbi:ATP-binding protein [Sphingomonas sp. MMS24-J13]|uniref:ATP-binding protein n=1 Tax=Sphingomonas sp. MMS24-J13 TaxID=3238686 RepID=UPI00384B463D